VGRLPRRGSLAEKGKSKKLAVFVLNKRNRQFESIPLHHTVNQFLYLAENRSKSARVRLLGHASVLVEMAEAACLMDPVFFDPFEEGAVVSCPARVVHPKRISAIDILVLSHRRNTVGQAGRCGKRAENVPLLALEPFATHSEPGRVSPSHPGCEFFKKHPHPRGVLSFASRPAWRSTSAKPQASGSYPSC
jgi:hypothetical protein